MINEEKVGVKAIISEEINRCIAILSQLNTDTNQIYYIPEVQSMELIKATGQFSRPDRDELSRR